MAHFQSLLAQRLRRLLNQELSAQGNDRQQLLTVAMEKFIVLALESMVEEVRKQKVSR